MAVPTADMEALGREVSGGGPGGGREDACVARAMVMARERPERPGDNWRTLWMEEGAVFVRDPRAREDTPAADALRRFAADRTFPSSSLESTVAEGIASAAADEALRGFNASLVACGASGTGKTWTLFGGGVPARHATEDDYVAFGVVGHIFHRVFECVAAEEAQGAGEGGGRRYEVGMAMWEVLDDQVLDLFAREPRVRGTAATSLTFATTRCRSVREALALLRAGQRRSSGFSADRAPSAAPNSGHTFVRIVLHDAAGGGRVSTLHVVDLAGNRTAAHRSSRLSPARRRAISQDHVALNRIVNALASLASRRRHAGDDAAWQRPPASEVLAAVPGRTTALARIMGPLLAGNSRTLLLACVDPAARCHAETVDTLGFAERVRDVDNVCMRLEGVPRAALALRDLDTVLGADDVLLLTTGGEAPLPAWPHQGEAVSGEAVSGEAVSGEAVSGEAVSGEAVSGEAVSGEGGAPSPVQAVGEESSRGAVGTDEGASASAGGLGTAPHSTGGSGSSDGPEQRASAEGSDGEALEPVRGGAETGLVGRGDPRSVSTSAASDGGAEHDGIDGLDGVVSVEAATRRLGGAKSRYAAALADVQREIEQRAAAIASRRGWEAESAAEAHADTTAGYASHVLYPHRDETGSGGDEEEGEERGEGVAAAGSFEEKGGAREESELFDAATGRPVTGDESLFLVGGRGSTTDAGGSGEGRRVNKLRHEIRAMMNELLPEAGEAGEADAEQGEASAPGAAGQGPERPVDSDEEHSFAGAYEMAEDSPSPQLLPGGAGVGDTELRDAPDGGPRSPEADVQRLGRSEAQAQVEGSREVSGRGQGADDENEDEDEDASCREIGGASAVPLPPRPEPYPSRGPLRAPARAGAPAPGPPHVGGAGQSHASGGAADSVERQLARLQEQLGGGARPTTEPSGGREGAQYHRSGGHGTGPFHSLEHTPAQGVLLSMLREETRLKELQARRVEEVRAELGEEVAQLTLQLHDRDLELVDLRARVRKLQAGTDFADVFTRYDRDIARAQEELQAARARVSALESARMEEGGAERRREAEEAVPGAGDAQASERDGPPLLTPAKVHTIQFLPDDRRKKLASSFSARAGDGQGEDAASSSRQQVSSSTGSRRGRAGRSRDAAVLGPWRKRVRDLERELASARKEVDALRSETRSAALHKRFAETSSRQFDHASRSLAHVREKLEEERLQHAEAVAARERAEKAAEEAVSRVQDLEADRAAMQEEVAHLRSSLAQVTRQRQHHELYSRVVQKRAGPGPVKRSKPIRAQLDRLFREAKGKAPQLMPLLHHLEREIGALEKDRGASTARERDLLNALVDMADQTGTTDSVHRLLATQQQHADAVSDAGQRRHASGGPHRRSTTRFDRKGL